MTGVQTCALPIYQPSRTAGYTATPATGPVNSAKVPLSSPLSSKSSVHSTDHYFRAYLAKHAETGPALSAQAWQPHPAALLFSRSLCQLSHGPTGQASVPPCPAVSVLSFSSLPSPSVPIVPGSPTAPSQGQSRHLPGLLSPSAPPKPPVCCSLPLPRCLSTVLSILQSALRTLSFHSPCLFPNRPPLYPPGPHGREAMI